MEKEKKDHISLILVIAVIIWGLHPTIVKLCLREMDVLVFDIMRFIVASIVCWILLLVKEKDWRVEKRDLPRILVIGAIGHFVYQLFYVMGINYTTAGNSSLIFGSLPVIVALINLMFRIEKIKRMAMIGIVASFIGITLVVIGKKQDITVTDKYFAGNLMIFFGTIAWAIYTVFNKKYLKKYSSLKFNTYAITISTILICIIWFKQIFLQDWSKVSIGSLGSIFYSGALSIAVASVLWSIGISKIGSTKTSIYNNITPVVSVICGMIFLNESFSFLQGVGAIFILIGINLSRNSKKNVKYSIENKYYTKNLKFK